MRLCHRLMKPWEVSLQRTPLNFSGKFISRNGKKKQEGKVGKASKGKRKFELFLFWPLDKDTYFVTFCEMWQEFNFVVQCKTQCRLNLQIEIPYFELRYNGSFVLRMQYQGVFCFREIIALACNVRCECFCLLIWRNQFQSTLFWRKIRFVKRERGLYLCAERWKDNIHALSLCLSVPAFSALWRYFQIVFVRLFWVLTVYLFQTIAQ